MLNKKLEEIWFCVYVRFFLYFYFNGWKVVEIFSKFNVYLLNMISEWLFLKIIFYDILFFGKLSNKICLFVYKCLKRCLFVNFFNFMCIIMFNVFKVFYK